MADRAGQPQGQPEGAALLRSLSGSATYQPGRSNVLIVFGSGTSTAPGSMPLSQFLNSLTKAYNPQRPVKIIMVSVGAGADPATLQQITAITHGGAYTIQQPSDIANVFFDALARRICTPTCGLMRANAGPLRTNAGLCG